MSDAESGGPVADAPVAWDGGETRSDGDGHFAIECVPEGATLAIEHPRYQPSELSADVRSVARLSLDRWHFDLVLVDASDGAPLAGATVASGAERKDADAQGLVSLWPALGDPVRISHAGYYTTTVVFAGQPTEEVALEPSRLTIELRDAVSSRPITRGLALAYVAGSDEPRAVDVADAGTVVLDDVDAIERVLIKVPGYRRVALETVTTGRQTVMLEPFESKGVYVPLGLLTRPERLNGVLDLVESSPELNTIVVDVKGDRAYLAWNSANPIARDTEGYIAQCMPLDELLQDCERRGIYVIARIVVFKDDLLAESHPEWAVMREDGSYYRDLEELRWVDPFQQAVRDYNIALAREVAEMGFDEVQFDYLRFPSDGSTKGNVYSRESNFETRTATMAAFCQQAHAVIRLTPAFLSADVFGLTVWVDDGRDMGIGQRLTDIAPNVDYVCPMLYPSTFGEGNLGFDYPVQYPYEVVYHSVLKTIERTDTQVRPWLQHYSLAVDYGVQELLRQKKGAEDAGTHGWLYWNSAAKYDATIFQSDAYELLDPWPEPPVKDE